MTRDGHRTCFSYCETRAGGRYAWNDAMRQPFPSTFTHTSVKRWSADLFSRPRAPWDFVALRHYSSVWAVEPNHHISRLLVPCVRSGTRILLGFYGFQELRPVQWRRFPHPSESPRFFSAGRSRLSKLTAILSGFVETLVVVSFSATRRALPRTEQGECRYPFPPLGENVFSLVSLISPPCRHGRSRGRLTGQRDMPLPCLSGGVGSLDIAWMRADGLEINFLAREVVHVWILAGQRDRCPDSSSMRLPRMPLSTARRDHPLLCSSGLGCSADVCGDPRCRKRDRRRLCDWLSDFRQVYPNQTDRRKGFEAPAARPWDDFVEVP
jgi:hypothetical protein